MLWHENIQYQNKMSSSNEKITQYEKNLAEKKGIVVMINENTAFYISTCSFGESVQHISHVENKS